MVKRLVLDVEKKYNPSIIELAVALSRLNGVDGSNIILYEIDKEVEVENVKVILGGPNIDYKTVKETIENGQYQGKIRSVDAVES